MIFDEPQQQMFSFPSLPSPTTPFSSDDSQFSQSQFSPGLSSTGTSEIEKWIMESRQQRLERQQRKALEKERGKRPMEIPQSLPQSLPTKPRTGIVISSSSTPVNTPPQNPTPQTYAAAATSTSSNPVFPQPSNQPSNQPPTQMMISSKNPISTFLQETAKTNLPLISSVEEPLDDSETDSSTETVFSSASTADSDSIDEQLRQTSVLMTTPFLYEEDAKPDIHSDDVPMEDAFHSAPPRRSHHSNAFKTFTIDDIPPDKWTLRFQEFNASGMNELQSDQSLTVRDLILNFTSRLSDTLKE